MPFTKENFMRPVFLATALCLSLTAPALAQEAADLPKMEAIEAAWAAGDYETVRQGLKRLAEETGSSLAQFRYARVLIEGRGGPVDLPGARDWLERAVAQNHLEAAPLLARLYLTGLPNADGDPVRDPKRAASILRNAAARGSAEAQYYLGLLYDAGDGIAADAEAAFNWWQAAAEQGHGPAQHALAKAYGNGKGTAVDLQRARYWMRQASHFDNPEAQFSLAQMALSGIGGPVDVSRALSEMTKAAEAGLPVAQRMLGELYLRDDLSDPSLALHWLSTAAKAGDAAAMSNLGHAFATGKGLPQDDTEALKWYQQASDVGLARATIVVARFQEVGRGGLSADIEKALPLYRRASLQGSEIATKHLGTLTVTGQLPESVPAAEALPWVLSLLAPLQGAETAPDETQQAALSWLDTTATGGNRDAMVALATLLLSGESPASVQDATAGLGWLQAAADAGSRQAQFDLGQRHSTGDGVALDYIAAHSWLNIAATAGLFEALELRDTLTALMTPDQLAEAQTRARVYLATKTPQPPATNQQVIQILPPQTGTGAEEGQDR